MTKREKQQLTKAFLAFIGALIGTILALWTGCASFQEIVEDVAEATCPELCDHILEIGGCGIAADSEKGVDDVYGTKDDKCGIVCDILFGADGLYDMDCAMKAETCEEVTECGL